MISECTMREFIQMVKVEDPTHKDIWEVKSPEGWKVLDYFIKGDALEEYTFWWSNPEEEDYDQYYPHDVLRYRRVVVDDDEPVLNTPWVVVD